MTPHMCSNFEKRSLVNFISGQCAAKRRIAISTDTSRGKQRYSQSGETIVSCNHCHKTHRFDNRDIFSFPQVGWE
jgi:hypothetical protein